MSQAGPDPESRSAPEAPHASERRQGILDAARRLFDRLGYAATTMEAVAVEAGVAKGSIYNYFGSKRDLFREVFTTSLAADDAAAAEVLVSSDGPARKLGRLFDLWFEELPRYRRIGGLVLEFWAEAAHQRETDLHHILTDLYEKHRRPAREVIAAGIASGEFRSDLDPDDAASLIFAVSDGLLVRSILDPTFVVSASAVAALKEAVLLAMGPGGRAASGGGAGEGAHPC